MSLRHCHQSDFFRTPTGAARGGLDALSNGLDVFRERHSDH
jgi:hypothetical protein